LLLPIAIAILPEASYGSIFKANGTNEAKTNGNSEKKSWIQSRSIPSKTNDMVTVF
jgi:hypothetical protein